MPTVTIVAKVSIKDMEEGDRTVAEKVYESLDVTNLAVVRRWVTLQFNKALAQLNLHDEYVVGEYPGRLAQPPHTVYEGCMSGNGKSLSCGGALTPQQSK